MRNVCHPMRRKYPDLQSIQQAGLLLEHEQQILERISREESQSKLSLHVINWALLLVRHGREQEIFESASDSTRLLDPIVAFKKSCSLVLKFKITAIPLSFVQAVSLTVHAFGAVSVMGRQFIDHSQQPPTLVIDVFLPILPTMQVI
jgi:Bestrophin, RFP-TM, chloride channel